MYINDDIKIIKRMIDEGVFNKDALKTILDHYQDHPAIIPCSIKAGAKIIRSSTNESDFHETISRLSYPPIDKARTDRASLEGKPMFYGSIFTSAIDNNGFPRIFSALETTDLLREYQSSGIVFTTQSVWMPDRNIHLFAFPFSRKYKVPCKEVQHQRSIWDDELSNHWSDQFTSFSEYLGELMSEVNHSCLYDITASAINFILYESTGAPFLDGVMYPSVQSDGQGMNICLKKETVDECIHFQNASVQCIMKKEGKATIIPVANSQLLPNGSLLWSPTDLTMSILEEAFGTSVTYNDGYIISNKQI